MSRSDKQANGGALTAVSIPSPAGVFTAHFSEQGLARLDFPSNHRPLNAPTSVPNVRAKWIALTTSAVASIADGKEPRELPPLDLRTGSTFQQRVWTALKKIPTGKTKTYGEIARSIGAPRASRAVGSACGANPIPLLIPCHRVLASGGGLGGFSGGLAWKLRLLAAEGGALTRSASA